MASQGEKANPQPPALGSPPGMGTEARAAIARYLVSLSGKVCSLWTSRGASGYVGRVTNRSKNRCLCSLIPREGAGGFHGAFAHRQNPGARPPLPRGAPAVGTKGWTSKHGAPSSAAARFPWGLSPAASPHLAFSPLVLLRSASALPPWPHSPLLLASLVRVDKGAKQSDAQIHARTLSHARLGSATQSTVPGWLQCPAQTQPGLKEAAPARPLGLVGALHQAWMELALPWCHVHPSGGDPVSIPAIKGLDIKAK